MKSLFCGFLFAALLPACSVPQFEPGPPDTSTPDQLITAGHYRRAQALLTAVNLPKETAPHDLAMHLNQLSRVQANLGELDPAMELVDRAIAFDPSNAALHVQAAAVAGRQAEHAGMFKQLALAKRVKKELDDALALDPKNADALYGLILFEQLAPSFLGGDKAKARSLSEQLTAIDAPRGYLAQARLAHENKNPAAEEAALKKAVDAGPDSYDAQIAFATFAAKSDPVRVDEADEHACLALELAPDRADAWQILAQLAAQAQCWREVDGLIDTAAKFDPDDLSPAYYAAAAMVETAQNLDTAQALLKRYLSQPQEGGAPTSGRARFQQATILEKRGQTDQALDLLRIALNEDPTMDDARKVLKRLDRAERSQ